MPRKNTAKAAKIGLSEHPAKARIEAKGRTANSKNSKAISSGKSFPVVGIGASAGGFEAVIHLLKKLPVDTGMAFVVVLHLDPRHPSKLPELLSHNTSMEVKEIRDGVQVEANTVHILPANADVLLQGRRLRLVRRPEGERIHLPIDHFFESLASELGSQAIGIILSGTGSDGTLGLTAIKAESGLSYAEAESSAKYFGMPRSAFEAGCVDAVLPVEEIAKELARVALHPLVRPRVKAVKSPEAFPESADALGKIFFLLRQSTGVDFSLYKLTTLKRRISRRMVLERIERVEEYVNLLRANPQELDALFHDLLINVTSFFRDKKVFASLKKKVVARIVHGKGDGGAVRVWVPGCATGEEVYSLAICLSEEIARSAKNLKLQIFGTDLSEQAIAKARTGIFPASIARDVSPERLRRFFAKSNGGYQISRDIREICTFARQNLCEDPPFSRLDLISCRNVLIYLGPELQKKCMPVFHYALNAGGYLMLGTSETVGSAVDLFTLVDKKNKIYIKKHVTVPASLDFTSKGIVPKRMAEPAKLPVFNPTPAEGPFDLQAEADRVILHRYAPSGVIIDTQMRVHEFRGRTGRFFEHSPGTATLNLLQMVRSVLVVDLRTAIHKALKDGAPVRKEGITLKSDGASAEVAIEVIPFHIPRSSETWLLVLFEEEEKPSLQVVRGGRGKNEPKAVVDRRDEMISHLRAELDANKESLQAIIEEQEATNEELKSANEEIESSNEELQSTNEELETAKEELQSTNEELITLNEELSNRNLEMAQMNNDLTNLLSSINIPIIMVDNSRAVRRATPLAEKLFNLIPTDIGRRLSDLKSNLHINDLDQMIREVIESLSTREQKVQDTQGHWYSLRIRPYRTRDNKIDGAVITLVDIDEQLRIITRLELASEYSDAILETIREPLVVLDSDLRVRKASRTFYEAFKLSHRKADGVRFTDLGSGEWDIPQLRSLLEEVLPKHKRLENFVVEVPLQKLGRRKLAFNARRLDNKGESLVLLAISDLSEHTAIPPGKRTKM